MSKKQNQSDLAKASPPKHRPLGDANVPAWEMLSKLETLSTLKTLSKLKKLSKLEELSKLVELILKNPKRTCTYQ